MPCTGTAGRHTPAAFASRSLRPRAAVGAASPAGGPERPRRVDARNRSPTRLDALLADSLGRTLGSRPNAERRWSRSLPPRRACLTRGTGRCRWIGAGLTRGCCRNRVDGGCRAAPIVRFTRRPRRCKCARPSRGQTPCCRNRICRHHSLRRLVRQPDRYANAGPSPHPCRSRPSNPTASTESSPISCAAGSSVGECGVEARLSPDRHLARLGVAQNGVR